MSHLLRTPHPGWRLLLAALLVFALAPLAWLLSVSLMSQPETVAGILFSPSPQWSNWGEVLTQSNVPRGLLNSLLAALGGALLTLALALPGAWAMARWRTGGALLAGLVTAPWLLPPIVAVVPLFYLLRLLGLNGTLGGLTLVYALVNVPVAVWLLDGFLRRLPDELYEAAQLDGAGLWRTLWSIVLPLMAPALVAVGIICAILNYNEFLLATFFTQSGQSQTLPVVLSLFYGDRTPHAGKIAAASAIGVLPVFLAAVLLQRWLVGGLTAGGVK
ncbi:MAG: carbohydrate ABC transporter permease [Comamonas sp.]